MDAASTPTPDPSDPFAAEPPPRPEQPEGAAGAGADAPSGAEAGPQEAEAVAPAPEEQAIPLTEASFLVGVSVQALRQRIKRGTLAGADAKDARGQAVAGVLPSALAEAFPERAQGLAGASESNAPGALVGSPRALGYPPSAHSFDPEADLEHGGMTPKRPALQGTVAQPGASGFNPWSIALVVAIAAVAVAGLVTGAHEARAANRIAEQARDSELLLREELRQTRDERDRALATVQRLEQELEELRSGR